MAFKRPRRAPIHLEDLDDLSSPNKVMEMFKRKNRQFFNNDANESSNVEVSIHNSLLRSYSDNEGGRREDRISVNPLRAVSESNNAPSTSHRVSRRELNPLIGTKRRPSNETPLSSKTVNSPEFDVFNPKTFSTPYQGAPKTLVKFTPANRQSSVGSAPMEIEEDFNYKQQEEHARKSSTKNKTQRKSSNMRETQIEIRRKSTEYKKKPSQSSPVSKKLKNMLQRCEASASKSPKVLERNNNYVESDLTDDEEAITNVEPQEDAIDVDIDAGLTNHPPPVDVDTKSKRTKQTKIAFLSKKSTQNVKKKSSQILARPDTPDFIQQPKSRLPQPTQMKLIASDSSNESNQISPEIAKNIRNLSRTGSSYIQEEMPRKIVVSKKRRMSVQPTSSFMNLASKKPKIDGRKKSLYTTPSCSDEEEEAAAAEEEAAAAEEEAAAAKEEAVAAEKEAAAAEKEATAAEKEAAAAEKEAAAAEKEAAAAEEEEAAVEDEEEEAATAEVQIGEDAPAVQAIEDREPSVGEENLQDLEPEDVSTVPPKTKSPPPKKNASKMSHDRAHSIETEEDAVHSSQRRTTSKKAKKQNNEAQTLEDIDELNVPQKPQSKKKSIHHKVPVEPELTDDESDDNIALATPVAPKKPKKRAHIKKTTKKSSPKQRYKRVVVCESSCDEDDDSGIVDPYFKYDPKENGCQRDGLRIRKYGRPWWMPGPSSNNIIIEYKNYTKKDMMIKEKIQKIMREKKVTIHQLMPNLMVDQFLPPSVNLKRLKDIIKERERMPSLGFVKGIGQRGLKKRESDEVQGVKEFVEVVKHSEPVQNSQTDAVMINLQNGTFSIGDVAFENAAEGIAVGHLSENCRVLKISPGCETRIIKSKCSLISIFMISGRLDFTVDGQVFPLTSFKFHNIYTDQSYAFNNKGKETAVFMMNRFFN